MNSDKQFKLIQTDNYKPGIFKVPGLRSVYMDLNFPDFVLIGNRTKSFTGC